MPKVKISEYSATANSNTDVASINIDEGCAPSGINNAIRAVMGHLKDFQSGTSNDPFTVGSSGSLTLSYGTINGVAYLNGSRVVTTGSALVFDGSKLTVSSSVEQFKLLSSGDFSSTGTGYLRFYDSVGAKGYLGYAGTAGRMDLQSGLGMNLNLNGAGGVTTFATSNTERARFNSTGALVFAGGTTTADGIGITFPATQSASSDANTLDDYEEGTWTPGVSFGGGTTGITYITQSGQYTKIGRQVTVIANVTLSSKGSSTGDATLTGLPFTNSTARSVGSIYLAGVTFADSPSILVEASNTIAYFRETTNAGVVTDLTNADFANNSNWTATITYFV